VASSVRPSMASELDIRNIARSIVQSIAGVWRLDLREIIPAQYS